MTRGVPIFLALGLAVFAKAASAKLSADASPGLALYSDACVHPETGDLLGTRIGILQLNRGFEVYFFYQEAAGVWEKPQVVELHQGEGNVMGSDFSFTIDSDGRPDTFRGKVTNKMIVGRFKHQKTVFGEQEFKLPRVSLNQKGYPDCH